MGSAAADLRERRDDARHVPARRATRRAALAGAGLILLAAPPAAAQEPPAPPPPAPAAGTLTLKAERVHRDGTGRIALTGEAWRVRGTLRPFVPGQTVRVRISRNGRQVHERTEAVLPAPDGRAGYFLTPYRSRSAGRVSVRAVHPATPELARIRSAPARVRVVEPRAGAGGAVVRLLQRNLARLRYAVSRSGRYDAATGRAVMAWRKVNGLPRSYAASEPVVRRVLAGEGAFEPRFPRDGRHVEADLSRQVLALVNGGRVHRVYHTSSGAPATPTVLGRYRVYRKDLGTNALGMVHSSYFIRGYAIHGYASVPPWNASHGCLRVPIPDARHVYDWIRMGDVVRVYP